MSLESEQMKMLFCVVYPLRMKRSTGLFISLLVPIRLLGESTEQDVIWTGLFSDLHYIWMNSLLLLRADLPG